MQEGDLDSFLRGRQGQFLKEQEVLLKFVQICLGLQHVHSKVRTCLQIAPRCTKTDSLCSAYQGPPNAHCVEWINCRCSVSERLVATQRAPESQ